MAKRKKWYGNTQEKQIKTGKTFVVAMFTPGVADNIPPAYSAAFEALVDVVCDLYATVTGRTATEDQKTTYHLQLKELIKKLQATRKTYIDGAGLDDLQWAAWGLEPRKDHHVDAVQITTALAVAHQYIRGNVGTVIFTFVPVGAKSWGREDYCDAFEMCFGEYKEGDPIPSTTAEIRALPGHRVFRTGRPKVNLEEFRGQNLMVFVRMVNAFPVSGPFNDPPDMVRVT